VQLAHADVLIRVLGHDFAPNAISEVFPRCDYLVGYGVGQL
jgi:hypothetical protein